MTTKTTDPTPAVDGGAPAEPPTVLAAPEPEPEQEPEPTSTPTPKRKRTPPGRDKVQAGWWLLLVAAVAAAAWLCWFVARGTHFTTGHRAAAAGTALLVVAALAVVAQVILLSYQVQLPGEPGATPEELTLAFRRRGLKAAVIGLDGRASTSKTQVVLWTGAVVWALVDLLLLARSVPGGSLFVKAVTTNWRPEYLVLLGLPVAAATAAKAAVVTATSPAYVRTPISAGVWGTLPGVAELFSNDDGTVAWADLQYVVFTLITLVYFASQFLGQPAGGLPAVPAALLTLAGVSATGYAANKIVSTKVA